MKKSNVAKIALIGCCILLFSGCDFLNNLFGEAPTAKPAVKTPVSDVEEDEKAKNLVKEFYTKLFAESIDTSYKNNVEGNVLDKVQSMISKDTITTKEKTPELPIHYPRFVELNGLTICGYEVMKKNGIPEINVRFYEAKAPNIQESDPNVKKDENKVDKSENLKYFAYYVDVNLRATVVKNDDFGTYFRYNAQSRLIDKLGDIPEEKADHIKVNARYDVLLLKSDSGDYKIESAIEATAKQNSYRLNKINNDFVTRMTFLNMDNAKEKDQYDKESGYLTEYIKKMMLNVDNEKYNILSSKWGSSPEDFSSYLDTLGLLKDSKKQDYLNNIVDKATYKTRFDIKAFPIKPGIEKVKSCEITINEHPSFTEKQRNYRVLVLATVDKHEGKISSDGQFVYEITAQITTVGDKLAINSYKLNQFNMKRDPIEEKK